MLGITGAKLLPVLFFTVLRSYGVYGNVMLLSVIKLLFLPNFFFNLYGPKIIDRR